MNTNLRIKEKICRIWGIKGMLSRVYLTGVWQQPAPKMKRAEVVATVCTPILCVCPCCIIMQEKACMLSAYNNDSCWTTTVTVSVSGYWSHSARKHFDICSFRQRYLSILFDSCGWSSGCVFFFNIFDCICPNRVTSCMVLIFDPQLDDVCSKSFTVDHVS